jgi:hypothetical protein
MMRASLGLPLLLGAVAACSQPTVQTPTRNLDRPTDIAQVCMAVDDGGTGEVPVDNSRCGHGADADAGLPISATLYSFVTNTTRGEVALVQIKPDGTHGIVDLDPTHPGYGFIPVGRIPERISKTTDGCRLATANAGTCDLSLIETTLAVSASASTSVVTDAGVSVPQSLVTTVEPSTELGRLGARPREVALLPGAGPNGVCDVTRTDHAVVSFPSCGLVALVELPSGRILDSVKLTSSGLVPAGTAPYCPVECVGGVSTDGGVALPDDGGTPAGDGGVDDGGAPAGDGGAPTPGTAVRTGALAVSSDGTRVYMAAADQPLIAVAQLTKAGLQPLPQLVRLDATTAGIKRLRLSPGVDVGETEANPANPAAPFDLSDQFLYAFAGDVSVHVVLASQTRSDGLTRDVLVECETNPDPRIWVNPRGQPANSIGYASRACVRMDASPRPRRAPFALTPGITPSAGVPKDVTFQTLTPYELSLRPTTTTGPSYTDGTFGWLAVTTGNAVLVNIHPIRHPDKEAGGDSSGYTLSPDPTLVLAHQIRNLDDITQQITSANTSSIGASSGPPRVTTMTRLADGVAYTPRNAFRIDDAHIVLGTHAGDIAQTLDEVANTSRSLYEVYFPDVHETRDESWVFTFQGALPNSVRATGNLDPSGLAIEDRGQPFCELGTQAGDIISIGGCVVDSQCGTGEACVTDPTAAPNVTGLCFLPAEAEAKREACGAFLRTLREYRVVTSYSDRLELAVMQEIRHVPGGCDPAVATETDRCNQPAPTDFGTIDATKQHYVCEPVAWRATGGECVRDCEDGRLCGDGYECDAATHRCIAGRTLDEAAKSQCFPELVPYYLLAGDAFLAVGQLSGSPVTGYLHRMVPSPTASENGHFACVDQLTLTTDPAEQARLALMQGRIPLLPPVCTNQPWSDWPPTPNPCRIDGVDEQYYFDTGGGSPLRDGRAVKAFFANPIINVGFLIGQLDAQGGLTAYPPPSLNYVIQADVGGWFQPYQVNLAAFLPETAVTGPDGFIYVVDSGLQGSASGLRGQLLRIDPVTNSVDVNFVVR